MSKIFSFALILAFQPIISQDFSKIISEKSDKINSKVIEWRRHFHQNPELGNREFKTIATANRLILLMHFVRVTPIYYL